MVRTEAGAQALLVEANPLPKGASQPVEGKGAVAGQEKPRGALPAAVKSWTTAGWTDRHYDGSGAAGKPPPQGGLWPPTYASRPLPPRRRRRYSARRVKLPSQRELLAPSTLCRRALRRAEVTPSQRGLLATNGLVYLSATFTMLDEQRLWA